MKRTFLNGAALAVALAVTAGNTTDAFPQGGQYPAPPAFADHLALPACGFAATESWGPNGFQYCDPRNIFPRRDGRG
jgi:hypothetical protein